MDNQGTLPPLHLFRATLHGVAGPLELDAVFAPRELGHPDDQDLPLQLLLPELEIGVVHVLRNGRVGLEQQPFSSSLPVQLESCGTDAAKVISTRCFRRKPLPT